MSRNPESQNLRIEEPETKKFVAKFRDLIVYQKAFNLSLNIHEKSFSFPKTEQYGGLADQMRRASKSICANIAEGYSKQQGSKLEFRRFLLISIGSAHEMQVWIDYCLALGYIDKGVFDEWEAGYDEIVRMLQTLYSKI